MKFILTAAALFSTAVSGSPVAKRDSITIQAWHYSSSTPNQNFTTQVDYCYELTGEWNKAFSLVSVPAGTECNLYTDAHCSGQMLFIPGGRGGAQVELAPQNFNDVTSSFLCYY